MQEWRWSVQSQENIWSYEWYLEERRPKSIWTWDRQSNSAQTIKVKRDPIEKRCLRIRKA